MYNIYIGYDSTSTEQKLAWDICKRSIEKNCSDLSSINIIKLEINSLIEKKLFYREDNDGSTEFTYTRFLVPYLNDYKDYALFIDNDFLFECDILELFKYYTSKDNPLSCVKHNYVSCNSSIKMNGTKQEWYPKKNWSSLMIFNCGHNDVCLNLTIDNVNNKSPKWLQRMDWCSQNKIIEIPKSYNYLVNYYNDNNIKALHFTDGGPWYKEYRNVEHAEKWLKYLSDDEKKILCYFF